VAQWAIRKIIDIHGETGNINTPPQFEYLLRWNCGLLLAKNKLCNKEVKSQRGCQQCRNVLYGSKDYEGGDKDKGGSKLSVVVLGHRSLKMRMGS
jgi:hypothetical protein